MDLIFLRHGIAIDRDAPNAPADDFARALTREGREKMTQIARAIRTLGIPIDHLLSSPLVRARETAELVAREQEPPPDVEILDLLAPGMDVDQVILFLDKQYSRDAAFCLVGHEPDFSTAVASLSFGVSSDDFSLKKGGMACVRIRTLKPRPRGTLLWLLTPKLLRSAADFRDDD
jgi:phosphohistidine phosphatase